MENPVRPLRPHPEGIYRPDQPRAAGIYDEVQPVPVAPRAAEPVFEDPSD